ncbi:MAG: hypothetical protein OJI67_20050 [Prosthecobacter sp.]|nr:hypothetical protein [Prosthecobacter sp.]
MSAPSGKDSPLQEQSLRQWSLIQRFQKVFDEISPAHPLHPTEHDPRRTLHQRAEHVRQPQYGTLLKKREVK